MDSTDKDKGEEKSFPLKQIRTFQGDVAEALEKQHESLVSIQRVEHLKKDSLEDEASKAVSKKRIEFIYLFLGIFLLGILSVGGVWYTYTEFIRKTTTPAIDTPANRFIYANGEITLNIGGKISREEFIKTLSSALDGVVEGEIRHVILEKTVLEKTILLPTDEFLSILGSSAPGNLVRALDPLFMLGSYGKSTFLIIKLSSFENAFGGMLTWEKNLNKDLGSLLTTREIAKNISPGTIFTDIIDRNKDIRVLSFYNQPTLLYSFLDNDTLIITDKIETLRALVDRLTQEKLSR